MTRHNDHGLNIIKLLSHALRVQSAHRHRMAEVLTQVWNAKPAASPGLTGQWPFAQYSRYEALRTVVTSYVFTFFILCYFIITTYGVLFCWLHWYHWLYY